MPNAVGLIELSSIALGYQVEDAMLKAAEVDLLERAVGKSTARAVKGGFSVDVPSHGIASVKVSFEE